MLLRFFSFLFLFTPSESSCVRGNSVVAVGRNFNVVRKFCFPGRGKLGGLEEGRGRGRSFSFFGFSILWPNEFKAGTSGEKHSFIIIIEKENTHLVGSG